MPIKKDGSGKRWVEMEFLVPGTPEQVWQAMATGPGNTAWFTETKIEERVGGVVRFQFGADMSSSGEVTVWEPPHRFGYVEREWSEGAPPVATEITVTSRSGGQCVVRMVHSLFSSSDDWDDQMEGFEGGWPGFFEVLRVYMVHFAGRTAASARAMLAVEGDHLTVWSRLTEALGLAGANVGERRASSQPEPFSGIVERVSQDAKLRSIMLRLETPAPGIAWIGTYEMPNGINASASIYYYGDRANDIATASQHKWKDWLSKTFQPKDK
jgi:uncharacterized protein YndB with AHSA1/START domain